MGDIKKIGFIDIDYLVFGFNFNICFYGVRINMFNKDFFVVRWFIYNFIILYN